MSLLDLLDLLIYSPYTKVERHMHYNFDSIRKYKDPITPTFSIEPIYSALGIYIHEVIYRLTTG